MKITEVKISKDYLIAQQSNKIDYEDSFQLKADLLKNVPKPKDCLVAFFKSFSPFLTKLIISREAIAKKLGLKTANKMSNKQRNKLLDKFEGNIGDSIAIFEVLDRTVNWTNRQTFRLQTISYQLQRR